VRLLGALAALIAGSAQACLPGAPADSARRVQLGDAAVEFRSEPIVVGEPFALEVLTCAGQRLTRVDADMPEHRHGMNYTPSLRELGPNRFRAEGMLFHMPGRWRITFELGPQRLTADLLLE
jgi:hypothetical protein